LSVPGRISRGAAAAILVILLAVGAVRSLSGADAPAATFGASGLRHGVIWYSRAANDDVRRASAVRYSVGITGKDEGSDADKPVIKSLNSEFRWFVYNSVTDNYVVPHPSPPLEHQYAQSLAVARGWDPEEIYLHYYDDTIVALSGDTTLFVPGWPGGSAPNPADARVPIYYVDRSRRLVHFSTRRAAQLHKETIIHLALDTPFRNSTLYPDGIFLDNSAAVLFNFGTIRSGGHVRETPGHLRIDTTEFRTWHWNNNLGPFLTALKDSLETSPSWSRDRKRKYLMVNVANVWDDSYVSRDIGDILFLEYQYNPVRSFGLGAMDDAHRRDLLAASAGITSFYSSVLHRTVPSREGSFTYAQTLLHNLTWYLITRTENTLLFQMEISTPVSAGWDSLTWRGCMNIANERLGSVTGEPFTLAQGTDPLGNRYVVKARAYQNGLAVLRNRGDWNQGIEPETAVNVPLPQSLLPVDPEGNIGGRVQMVSLRNGQGALFLASGAPTLFTLAVGVVGSGTVRVTPFRSGYAAGANVNLQPNPSLGWRFSRWEGDLTGNAVPASLRMDASRSVRAVFVPNNAPRAVNDAYSAVTDAPIRVEAPGVLGNDSDPDGDRITPVLRTAPSHGFMALYPDGSFAYLAAPGFTGTDRFTYEVQDGLSGTATATVTLTVGGQPGLGVSFGESQTGGSSAASTVATSAPFAPSTASLFMAAIASKPYRPVRSVSGFGLDWTLVQAQCGGRSQTGIDVWMARGNATAGNVTATFGTAPINATIAVSRYTGADLVAPLGTMTSVNTNGVQGTCSGGVDGSRYSLAVTGTTSRGVVFAAVAMRNRQHTPGAGVTQRATVRQGVFGDETSLAVIDRPSTPGTLSLTGTFNSITDWAVAGVEIRPSGVPPTTSAPETERALPLVPALRLSPNPARGTTSIDLDLPAGAMVRVSIHDAAGRRIRTLASGALPLGSHRLTWDGRDNAGTSVPSGVYFVQSELGASKLSRKLVWQR